MSTCSTATSALRGYESRRRRRRAPPATCDAADVEAVVHGLLERRLVDLERDWDAYKTGQSGAALRRHHRRSRSATATPSSAVTTVAAPDALLLPLYRCSSPRTLVSSLQQAGSANSGRAAKIVLGADSPAGSYEGGISSVCSVEAGYSAAAPSSSCSCPCRCRCAVCCCSYSTTTSSSCVGASAPPFSSAAGGAAGERSRKSDEGRTVSGTGRAGWIAAVALVVMGFVAMVMLELRMDEGCAEYLVPT
ncbi:hypothetical protein SEVIR_7G079300v4 [Setaria viridis]|uniref:Uncharacterized protein n=1 Tax=Setaria viridis TaxID=4556 RepID=A0A4U6TRE4_SETVI|nr:hypothetical protein SEVIR_7G079300v2 [Setaria viridis]